MEENELGQAFVRVSYLLAEQSPDRLEKTVIDPLERIFFAIPRVSGVTSIAGHGYVNFEVRFEGAASRQDLIIVRKFVNDLALDIVITSCTATLVSPPE